MFEDNPHICLYLKEDIHLGFFFSTFFTNSSEQGFYDAMQHKVGKLENEKSTQNSLRKYNDYR